MLLAQTHRFTKALQRLSRERARAAVKALELFEADQYHPGLNFEKLKSPYSSIRCGGGDRVVLRRTGTMEYELVDVGGHDINRKYG